MGSKKRILLVEPDYYTKYPPLGLLKLSAFHKEKGDSIVFVRGCEEIDEKFDRIYVTSLFTWAWKPVWKAVEHYKDLYPQTEVWLGGLYVSLMPEHAEESGADRVWKGLFEEAEGFLPDYSLVPEWDGSILFSARGCNNNCDFCAVPSLEGDINSERLSIKDLIYPDHSRIIFWDNNFLQNPHWRKILQELEKLGLKVDFNQGLDAKLITQEAANLLSKVRLHSTSSIKIRLGYDRIEDGPHIKKAIENLNSAGIRKRAIMVYCLYNFRDSPKDFLERGNNTLKWGAVCYPMRYQPVEGKHALEKDSYVNPNWTEEELEMIQDARRVMGYGGSFPPYDGLLKKIDKADNFYEAFKLRPPS